MNTKDSKLHLKLYTTIIFCVVIAIFITSTILYINFQTILMKHEYKSKLDKMESEAAQISKLSDIALSTLFQIYNDISVKKLLTYKEIDAIDESAAFMQLRGFLVTIPYVDSIYVYNMKNNRIYIVTNEEELVRPWSTDYFKKTSDFYDQSAVDMLDHCTDYLPYIPVPRYYKVNDNYTKCVYSYMMYNTFNSNNSSNVVMLNLESQYLFQDKSKDELQSISLVLDQNYNVIYSNTDQFKEKDQLQNDFELSGTMDKEKSGYFLTEINGKQSVVIFTEPDQHQWRYVSMIEYDVLLSQVRKLQAITIFISLLIACIGGLVAHIYSRKLTVPIRDMSMNIKNLESEKRRSEIITKNMKLIEILDNGGVDNEGRKRAGTEFLAQLGMELQPESKIVLFCLSLDRYKTLLEKFNAKEIQAFKFSAINILKELLGDKIKTYYLDSELDKRFVFIQMEDEHTREKIELALKKMQSNIKEYFSITISVVVSHPEDNPDQLFYLYEKMKETIARSIFLGAGYMVYAPELDLKIVNDYEYPEQKEKYLMESLILGKTEETRRIYEDIIAETYQYPIVIYNMVINRLIFAIDNVVNLMQKNGALPSFSGFITLSNLLQDIDTLDKRNDKFYELFEQIQKEQENKKNEKHQQIIEKINQMIEDNFEDPSFSLDSIAETIGMSTAYLCRMYKQYTCNTIIEILISKRMEKAKQLLAETTMPVNEIAEKVGYINPSYFYRVFKKENGVTPKEFRKK